ncbi:hypothetical protein FOL47_010267 [Perkinsus chesapeaki]|uniref:Conserved oligomeric Golgi complex subunit 5 N-terminal domain-containing protein n=1 Tax=Perkinsus chesapeaki TaxID=330153 RepID=A0A7J6L321_PERCH|nr:hypothetical protein FOL47_010267 [Perkinsus chesapeaki]
MTVLSPRQRSGSRLATTEESDPAAAAAYSRLLENFMSPDFDVATFVREMVTNAENKGAISPAGGGGASTRRRGQQQPGGAVGAVIAQLDQAIFTVDEQLRSKVADCYDQLLLNDTTDLDRVERELRQVRESVAVLKATMQNVQSEAVAPFRDIKRRLDTLERAQKAAGLVRSTQRLLIGVRKLRMQMQAANAESASAFDYGRPALGTHSAKAAILASGLETLLSTEAETLERLPAISKEVAFIHHSSSTLRKQASEALTAALQPEVGSNAVAQRSSMVAAVQVLFELGCLATESALCAAGVLSNVDAFALQVPGQDTAQGDIVNEDQFWRVAHRLGEAISQFGRPVMMLDEFIRVGIDPLTQQRFMSAFQADVSHPITRASWEAITGGLAVKRLKHAHTTNRNLRGGKVDLARLRSVVISDPLTTLRRGTGSSKVGRSSADANTLTADDGEYFSLMEDALGFPNVASSSPK